MSFKGFDPSLLGFLDELAQNNERDWFAENKHRYERLVREPALDFIVAMGPLLDRIAPEFEAVAKKMGGSLMRVFRDTRFGRDKTPYKTNVGIQFRHTQGKDVHAPGYYLHIEPGAHFIGAGMWRPDPDSLAGIRTAIVERASAWKSARDAVAKTYSLDGGALKRPPRGYPVDHPMIDDIKRTDFIATRPFDDAELFRTDFAARVAKRFEAATPLMKFLCRAVGVPF
ncbi:MAG TPA: DUF2461 domain-containing protein [Pseudomonadales bacterium]|jgi:uncharacterized protein (TIGR02453 family)|nr:DUF2461 domain-containing protein [Pseudomonadales bacterium]